MDSLIFGLNRLNEWIGRLVSWLALVMVLMMALVVALRYFFDYGNIALQESVLYMFAALFMLGAGFTYGRDGHVRVDIFYKSASPRRRAWVDLLGNLFLLMPTCLFIFISSWDYVANSWALLEGSKDAGGLDLVFLLKSMIPAMCVLLLVQGVASVLSQIRTLTGGAH